MIRIIFTMLILAVSLTGCATSANTAHETLPVERVTPTDKGLSEGNNEKALKDIVDRVRKGNYLFNSGKYKDAEKVYQELLDEYSSKDGSFETAVQTNLCMAYIEQGERVKFKFCGDKLKETSRNLNYLSRETQMVLELSDTLGNIETTKKDLRIDSRLSNGINQTFKEEN